MKPHLYMFGGRWFVRVDTHAGRVLNPGRATLQDAWAAAVEHSKYTSAVVAFERISQGVRP